MDRHLRRLLPLALMLLAAVRSSSLGVAASEASADTSTTPPLKALAWGTNFSGGSVDEASRDAVVRGLVSGAANSDRGFFSTSSNNVYGVAMCYADGQRDDCQRCLNRAAAYLFTECAHSSSAAIMYSSDCVLRYSNVAFFSNETEWGHQLNVWSTSFVDDVASWNETRWTMMTGLVAAAAVSPQRLATGNATYTDGAGGTVYGLVQCREDLSPGQCSNCLNSQLQYLLGNFPNNVNTYVSVRGFSCFIKQDVNPIALMAPVPSGGAPSPSSPAPATSSCSSKAHKMAIIGLATAASVMLFLLILETTLLFIYWRQWRQKRTATVANQESNDDDEGVFSRFFGRAPSGPKRFAYDVLAAATGNFSDGQKLGEGGFGSVYRGFLEELRLPVAIKRVSSSCRKRRKEYAAEVTIISQMRHRNLVKLIGWCHSHDELLLVYELMSNKSLDMHLYSAESVLSWQRRYHIILGIGSALLYLHQECEQGVLHRDIKPSNVMLDASFSAKLGDFGLARLVDHARGTLTTELAGTMGYMDPACIDTGKFSTQSDVYSFGVVLLEVACGREPAVIHQGRTIHLAQRVLELYKRGAILDAADFRLRGDFDAREMECVLVVGLWCTKHDPTLRPSIREAVSALRFEASLPTATTIVTKAPPVGRSSSDPSSLSVPDEGRVTSRMNLSTY